MTGAVLFSQTLVRLSTSNRKAKKYYQKAEYYLQKRDTDGALQSLQNALSADSNFIEAHLLIGEVYENTHRDTLALRHYEKMMAIDSSFYPYNYYYAGNLAFAMAKYRKALKYFNIYLKVKGKRLKNQKDALKKIANCKFAIQALAHPVDFVPVNMGANINSPLDEYFPTITEDDSVFLFTRRLPDARALNGEQEDFFVSYRQDTVWGPAKNIGSPINTLFNEGAPSLSQDGHQLFFTACETPRGYGEHRKGLGRCDIFVSVKNGQGWGMPENLGAPVNSSAWESQPSFSSDGKSLYFVSNRKGGYDIFVSRLSDEGQWSEPVALGDNINTPGRESSVFIHPDNRTLYFASDGWPGMGGMDLFMSRKDSLGNWQKPVNLGYPINTHSDENSILIGPKGEFAYFASDRKEGLGGLDIYRFKLPPAIQPGKVNYLKGKVFDKNTLQPLAADIELIDMHSGQLIATSFTDRKTGAFLTNVLLNHDYILHVRAKGYLFYSGHFRTSAKQHENVPLHKDIPMTPIRVGEKLILKNIFFDTDKSELKETSLVELNKLIELLNRNSEIRIQIGGFTDNTGSPEHNLRLSQQRAQAVYQYLVEHGIAAERLTYKGFGAARPVASNDTEEGRRQNRRTEIMIVK